MGGADEIHGDDQTNILIVDDLPEKHLAYRVMLEDLGKNIIEAHSGADALRQILKTDFAVILLDVNMPGLDGFETARLIHQRKRSAATPIIFLTAFSDEVRMAQGYATGAVDYLPMPVVPGILRAKVRVFVDLYEMRRKMAHQAEERIKQAAIEVANRRLSFLADASAKLGRSLDITTTVREIVRLPVPFLADVAALKMSTVVDDDNRLLVSRFASSDELIMDHPHDPGCYLEDVQEAIDRVMSRSEMEVLSHRPGVVLPLQARGRTVAALALFSESAVRHFEPNDIKLAEAFSFRAAMALDNALLHEEIRSADRQKNDFLSMLAHELRNPLAPIRNAVQLIEHRVADDGEVKWACDVIDRQVVQLVRLVDDLLDVARITHDKISLHRETMELKSAVNLAIEASRPLIDSRKQRLHVALSPSPMYILGDMARLTQVLTNLLNNSVKFTEERGQIWLSTSVEGNFAVVRIRDNGIGIPPQMLESVFQLFTQVNRTLDRNHEGLGIGLTLVKRLVEKHEGSVEARSEGPGRGSEFVIRLPLIASPALIRGGKSNPGLTNHEQRSRRVLVVDDNRDSAQSLAMMLGVMGQKTDLAYDGIEAIKVAESFKPDLILLDIGLPRMNGYEVCQHIRDQADGKEVMIVALTGWGQEEDQRRSSEAGFDKHVVKPVSLDTLKELLAQVKTLDAQFVG